MKINIIENDTEWDDSLQYPVIMQSVVQKDLLVLFTSKNEGIALKNYNHPIKISNNWNSATTKIYRKKFEGTIELSND